MVLYVDKVWTGCVTEGRWFNAWYLPCVLNWKSRKMTLTGVATLNSSDRSVNSGNFINGSLLQFSSSNISALIISGLGYNILSLIVTKNICASRV